jgi:hypothetical protein
VDSGAGGNHGVRDFRCKPEHSAPSAAAANVAAMSGAKDELAEALESYYRSCGWQVERATDGTVRARGWGGVTWIGLPIVADDLDDSGFEQRLVALSSERMPSGELCPLELLPSTECEDRLRAILDRLRLHERGHVEVYAVAA